MTRSHKYRLALTLGILMFLGIGCANANRSKISYEPLGVTTFSERDAELGVLRGTYNYEGHVITFEAVRGQRNPIRDLEGPRYTTDARLCDDQSFCFALSGGGSELTNKGQVGIVSESQNEQYAFMNQASAWAMHHDLHLLERTKFKGLEEQLDSLEALTNVPDPRTHELPRT